MVELTESLHARLVAGRVARSTISAELTLPRGVCRLLTKTAKAARPPLVVERWKKGQAGKVEYHLRPAGPGEMPGATIEHE